MKQFLGAAILLAISLSGRADQFSGSEFGLSSKEQIRQTLVEIITSENESIDELDHLRGSNEFNRCAQSSLRNCKVVMNTIFSIHEELRKDLEKMTIKLNILQSSSPELMSNHALVSHLTSVRQKQETSNTETSVASLLKYRLDCLKGETTTLECVNIAFDAQKNYLNIMKNTYQQALDQIK